MRGSNINMARLVSIYHIMKEEPSRVFIITELFPVSVNRRDRLYLKCLISLNLVEEVETYYYRHGKSNCRRSFIGYKIKRGAI